MTEFVSGQINQLHASSTDETVCPTRCYAGFWMRFWAYLDRKSTTHNNSKAESSGMPE